MERVFGIGFSVLMEVDYGKFKILIKLVCGFKLIFMVYVMIIELKCEGYGD